MWDSFSSCSSLINIRTANQVGADTNLPSCFVLQGRGFHPSFILQIKNQGEESVNLSQLFLALLRPVTSQTSVCLAPWLSLHRFVCLSAHVACSESAALRSGVMLQLHVDRQVDTTGKQAGRQTRSRDRRVVSVSWSYLVVAVSPCVRLPSLCFSPFLPASAL